MQIQSKNNYSQSNNTNFGVLKKIYCSRGSIQHSPCKLHEINVMNELKGLAKKDKFFKENDVYAIVSVKRWYGTHVRLASKPTPKNLFDKIKNFFIRPTHYMVENLQSCPDDSSYFVARRLRNIKDSKESFSDVFSKVPF